MLASHLLSLTEEGTAVQLQLSPANHGPVTEEAIYQLLCQPSFAKLRPDEATISQAVGQINLCCAQGSTEPLSFILATQIDGQLKLSLSADSMEAELTLYAPWGGKPITFVEVLEALKQAGICKGLRREPIESLLRAVPLLAPGDSQTQIIAVGKAAVHGVNASIERRVPLARERLLQPSMREDGTADLRDLGAVVTVKPGVLLLEKQPATPGTHGFNVMGKVLEARPGKDLMLKPGPGTAINPANPLQLIALLAGQPVEIPGGIKVDDVLQIKEVDVKYGHVDFKGSVLISADVHEGMQVKASGNVTVLGFVDSAQIEAGGDIIVSKGVIGRQLPDGGLSSRLKAQGQIAAQFVQYARLEADGDILITKGLLHSHSHSRARIQVSDASGHRGELVGGEAHAAKGISAVTLGATAGTKTDIFCAMDYGKLKDELKVLADSVQQLVLAYLELDNQVRKLPPPATWQQDPAQQQQVRRMLSERRRIKAERDIEIARHEALQRELDNYYQDYCVQVAQRMFNNVELHLGPANCRTQREFGPCTVRNNLQDVQFDFSQTF